MEAYQHIIEIIALSMGVAWASGINLYLALLVLGFLSNTGNLVLPPELEIVADPLVMMAAGFMYFVEFFADKMPGVDTGWDALHTFIRPFAGAILAAGAVGEVGVAAQVAAAIVGGGIAAGTHAVKAGSRVIINTSPEPVTNWGASIGEDLLVLGGLWSALHHPVLFLVLLVAFVLLMIWLLPRLWRLVKVIFARVRRFLSGGSRQDLYGDQDVPLFLVKPPPKDPER